MKTSTSLSGREEYLLNFLWKRNVAMTTSEIATALADQNWSQVSLYKTIQSLSERGYLDVVGLEKATKTYVRKLAPTLSQAEYYTASLLEKGVDATAISEIAVSLIGAEKIENKEDRKLIAKNLEEVLKTLKK